MKAFNEIPKDFIKPEIQAAIRIIKITAPLSSPKTCSNGVFGVYRPDPIDKQAAMMLAKSRWSNPPKIEVKATKPKRKKKTARKKPKPSPLVVTESPTEENRTILCAKEALVLLCQTSISHF